MKNVGDIERVAWALARGSSVREVVAMRTGVNIGVILKIERMIAELERGRIEADIEEDLYQRHRQAAVCHVLAGGLYRTAPGRMRRGLVRRAVAEYRGRGPCRGFGQGAKKGPGPECPPAR